MDSYPTDVSLVFMKKLNHFLAAKLSNRPNHYCSSDFKKIHFFVECSNFFEMNFSFFILTSSSFFVSECVNILSIRSNRDKI